MQGAGRGCEAKADASTAEVETSTRCEHGRGNAGEPLTRHVGRESFAEKTLAHGLIFLQGKESRRFRRRCVS